jgi:endoglucanase
MRKNRTLTNLTINSALLIAITAVSILFVRSGNPDEEILKLNDKGYFEMRGFNLLAFENQYNGMFFDEKTAGIMIIHHGVRTATGGAVRLKSTPEQWDQIPVVADRKVNKETNSIDILLRYADFDFDSRVQVKPQGKSVLITVTLDKPLP